MTRTPRFAALLPSALALSLATSACTGMIGGSNTGDGGRDRIDARRGDDGPARDANTGDDANPGDDAASATDSAIGPDAEALRDSAIETDAATPSDSGTIPDAGTPTDPLDLRARPAHAGVDPVSARTLPSYVRRSIHVAADGDDSRSIEQATNPATPWRTVQRVNDAMSSLGAGDAVLFRRGDTFRGLLRVTASGSESNPLLFGAYGGGETPPVLSGADVVTGFASFRGEIRSAEVSSRVERVFVDGREMPLARTPNVGLLRNSAESNSSVTAAGLGAVNWAGGRVWVHTEAWLRESRDVAGQSGDTVRFAGSTAYTARANAGFIVEGALDALDDAGEWFWGDGRLYLRLPAGSDWSSARVEATTRTHSVTIADGTGVSDLEFRGLELANSAGSAWAQLGFHTYRIRVADCVFRNSDTEGLSISGHTHFSAFERNHFAGVRGAAAALSGAEDSTFARNVVEDQFMQPQRSMGSGTGCGSGGCARVRFEENYFARSGFHALSVTSDGDGVIRRNVVIDAMQLMSDGGAIYTYGGDSQRQQFIENVVVGAPGSGAGAHDGYDGAYGIYMDNAVTEATVARNLVVDGHYGIFFNTGGSGSSCDDNAVVGGAWGLQFNTGVRSARRNLVFATRSDAWGLVVDVLESASPSTLGALDENVYRHPFADRIARVRGMGNTWGEWRSGSGQDGASRFDSELWPSGARAEDRVRVVANTSLAPRAFDIGEGSWVDARTGTASPRTFTLEPFAFRVLERR